MAAHARHISLLLFGLVILTTHSARVEAEDVKIDELHSPEEKNNGSADHALTTRGYSKSGNVVNYFNNDGDDDDDADDADDDDSAKDEVVSTSSNNSGKGKQIISGANINIGAGSGDSKGSNAANSFSFGGMTIFGMSNFPSKITSSGNTCEMNFNGITLRGMNIGNKGVTISNNKIFVGDKLICENIKKAPGGEPTYQKMDDGSLWYTNINIGKPMNKAEIDKFDADWAVHKKEEEERAAEREREHKQRMEEHNKRMEEHMEEHRKRMEEHNKRMAEHNKRMEEHRQRMKQQAEERERRQKERMDAMNERLKKQAEERERRMKGKAEDRERRANRASMNRSSSFW